MADETKQNTRATSPSKDSRHPPGADYLNRSPRHSTNTEDDGTRAARDGGRPRPDGSATRRGLALRRLRLWCFATGGGVGWRSRRCRTAQTPARVPLQAGRGRPRVSERDLQRCRGRLLATHPTPARSINTSRCGRSCPVNTSQTQRHRRREKTAQRRLSVRRRRESRTQRGPPRRRAAEGLAGARAGGSQLGFCCRGVARGACWRVGVCTARTSQVRRRDVICATGAVFVGCWECPRRLRGWRTQRTPKQEAPPHAGGVCHERRSASS